MSLFSLDLLEDMERMRREFDRILGEERLPAWTLPFSRMSFLPGRASRAYPLLNISEDDNKIYIDALAPGIDPTTLNVSVTGDQLVISGEKKPLPKDIKPEAIHRSERSAGQFARSLSLPAAVETEKVEATYTNGVVKVTLPKSETARPKQIEVRVG